MKNKYIICLLVSLLFLNCAEDKGNYVYVPIDELQIDGIESFYAIIPGDSLKIPVTLSHSRSLPDQQLNYLWEIDGKEVAATKDLMILTPPDMSFGNKTCRFTITDPENGMKYFHTFTIDIVSPFNWGYYLLTENEDHSSLLSYLSVTGDTTRFIHTTSVGGIGLGAHPLALGRQFGRIATLKNYYWSIYIMTAEGENPVIVTENATFTSSKLINSTSFIEKDAGYQFAPQFMQPNSNNIFFVSNGQFVTCYSGMLYRPASHDQYYWSYPVRSGYGEYVFDMLTQKYYLIKPQTNDPEKGIIGDTYTYDSRVEIKNFPDFSGHTIIGNNTERTGSEYPTIATVNPEGINLVKLSYDPATDEGKYVSTTTFPLPDAGKSAQAIIVGQDWYFAIGNKIYTSPVQLPALSPFVSIPEEYGKIVNISCSVLESLLVVATYDPDSPEEWKGSVLFIDIQTRQIIKTFPHVIHKCVSMLSCNSDPYSWGYGDNK